MRRILAALCIFFAGISALSAPRQKAEVISGLVVAYSSFPACLNGNGYWSIVIRVKSPTDVPS
jgi:hypothetical protein